MPTPNKNLNLPANASANWDVPLNSNFSMLDTVLAGTQVVNVTGNSTTPITLTPTFPLVSTPITSMSYLPYRIVFSGNVGQDTVFYVPAGIAGLWVFGNFTNAAHSISIANAATPAGAIVVPPGAQIQILSDGATVAIVGILPSSAASVGDYKETAANNTQAGWIICDGRAVSRTTYAALFAVIGTTYGAGDGSTTFNVPDRRGRVGAGADNMGGTAASRLPGYSLAVTGGAPTVSLTGDQNGSHNHSDFGHGHPIGDSGHIHGGGGSGASSVQLGAFSIPSGGNTAVGYANVYINAGYANISYSGSGNPHNNVQPTIAVNVYIYAGV